MNKYVIPAIFSLTSFCGFAEELDYLNVVPSPNDSTLYYGVGGGNIVPAPPSTEESITVNLNGIGGIGYNCGLFNQRASIANALNGAENTAMNMFNGVVNEAEGAIIEMPAYLIAQANPALYQLMQNGLQSSQFDFNLGLKSCSQIASEINDGKDPYSEMYSSSMHSDWKSFQTGSSYSAKMDQLTYGASSSSDISNARVNVNKTNGKKGVQWTHGNEVDGSKHAGGQGQPPILLTYDITVAGINALLSRQDYYSMQAIPAKSGISKIFSTPEEAAKWAESVLGEKSISTSPSRQSAARPGKGLLPKVNIEYQEIYKKLTDLVEGGEEPTVDNLKAVSSNRLMISSDVILNLQNASTLTRSIEITALAQGVSALKVINRAQEIILAFQAARQVPSISLNSTAQKYLDQSITTLQHQIKGIVDNREHTDKILTSTIQVMNSYRQQQISDGNLIKPAPVGQIAPEGGVMKK